MEDIQLRVTIEIFKVLLIDSNNLWTGKLDHAIDRAIEIGKEFSEKYWDSTRNPYPNENTSSF